MRRALLLAGLMLSAAACDRGEDLAPIAVDNNVVVNEDEGNVGEVVLDHCGEPVRPGQRPPHPKTACK